MLANLFANWNDMGMFSGKTTIQVENGLPDFENPKIDTLRMLNKSLAYLHK